MKHCHSQPAVKLRTQNPDQEYSALDNAIEEPINAYYQLSSGIKIEAGLSAQVKSQQH